MFKRRKDGGFTLIELMIVIAVIGILAVVLVPKMSGIKTSAKVTGVQTNVKSVQVYVTANLDKWITSNKSEAQVSDLITGQFNDNDNKLKNPFSGQTTMESDISGTAFVVGSLSPDDSLQTISNTTDLGSTNSAHGAVVVNLQSYKTEGIQIAGYDQEGNLVDSVVTIKP